jgi:hypothetical protein
MFTGQAMRGFINTISIASEKLPAAASRARLIALAIEERDRVLGEAVSRSGMVPSYRQVVDGVLGAPLTAVKPGGYILFSWMYLGEVVREIVRTLAARAPVETGAYLESIIVFVDGVQAAMGANDEVHLKEIVLGTKRIVIVPTVPYARRLEVGMRRDAQGRRTSEPFVIQVAPHIVEQTAIATRRLYSNFADISFDYVDISNPHVLKRPYNRKHRHDRTNTMVRYPAIIIEPRVP